MKKRWLVVPVVVGLLAFGIVSGGAVLSHVNGTDGNSPSSSFASRVAEILEIDEAQVQDAMNQARMEIQDEVLQGKLDSMVEAGRITQEQADAYLEWYQSRPEGLYPGSKRPGFGFGRGHHFRKGHFSAPSKGPSESSAGTSTTY